MSFREDQPTMLQDLVYSYWKLMLSWGASISFVRSSSTMMVWSDVHIRVYMYTRYIYELLPYLDLSSLGLAVQGRILINLPDSFTQVNIGWVGWWNRWRRGSSTKWRRWCLMKCRKTSVKSSHNNSGLMGPTLYLVTTITRWMMMMMMVAISRR